MIEEVLVAMLEVVTMEAPRVLCCACMGENSE